MKTILPEPVITTGRLSAYNYNPTVATLKYREERTEQIPKNYKTLYDVFLAVPDANLIGAVGTLFVNGNKYSALVFDCGGIEDGGKSWMLNRGIVAEVDYWFWQEHPELIGSGIEARLELYNYWWNAPKRETMETDKSTGIPGYTFTTAIAEELNVHITTVQTWLKDGRLNGYKVGEGQRAFWLVPDKDYEDFKNTYKKGAHT